MTPSDQIRQFIAARVGADDELARFSDEDDIFKLGLVSSLFAIQIVAFVESEFGVVVDNDELSLPNFSSVTRIAQFVARKRGES